MERELQLQPGQCLGDKYELIGLLGEGGFGAVWKARQLSTGQLVAVKLLLAERLANHDGAERATARFVREMELIGQLRHPNIVKLIDSGTLPDGKLFIALEYVEGESLADLTRAEGGLSVAETVHLMSQVLEALSAAHQRGVVHRDLKPHNIMVTTAGYRRNALVLDFGIAGIAEDHRPDDHVELTDDRAITGSPAYMAPEQISHKPTSPRMDIYTWGLVTIECLTGSRAIEGTDSFEVMFAQINPQPVTIPPEIRHPGLRRILRKATRKNPAKRYASVDEILVALEGFDPDAIGEISEENTVDRTRDRVDAGTPHALALDEAEKRGLNPAWIAVGVVVVGLVGAVIYLAARQPAEAPQPAAEIPVTDAAPASPTAPVAEPNAEIDPKSVAVLPFANLSADPENAWFSDGLAEELTLALGDLDGLHVAPRTSAFKFRDSERSIEEIATELSVATVLEGSVRKAGDEIRVAVSLVDGASGEKLWTERFDRTLDDVFAIQDEIARSVVSELQVTLVGDAAAGDGRIVEPAVDNTEAYNLYLRGRFYWNKRNPVAAQEAIDLLEQAIDVEPGYALAYAGLADMYNIMAWFSWIPAGEGYPKAEEAALKALELDPSLGEVYASLAVARLYWHWDWAGCEAAYLEGHEKAPEFATGHQWYGSMFLVPLGRFDEAAEHLAIARELDPISPIIQTDNADVFYYSARYDEAIAAVEPTIEMHPEFFMGYYTLGRHLVQAEREAEAYAALDRALELSNDATVVLASIGYARGFFGDEAGAKAILARLDERATSEAVQAAFYARVHAGLGDVDAAFEWLDKAVDDHSAHLIYLKTDPAFAGLRDDPRFAALLARIGVSAYEAGRH